MSRLAGLVHGVAGALLVIFPVAGAVLLLARRRFKAANSSGWLIVWSGYLLPLAVVAVASGRGLLMPVLQTAFGIALGLFVTLDRRRALVLGVAIALAFAASAGLVERELSRRMWSDASTPMGIRQLLSGVSELSGESSGWTRNGVRQFEKTWLLRRPAGSAETEGYLLSFELRGTSPFYGWQWYTNDPATTQLLAFEGDRGYTLVEGLVSPIVKRLRTGAPLAGRTVRASLELRAPGGSGSDDDYVLALRTFEPSASVRRPVKLGRSWRRFELSLTFPAESVQGAFEVVLASATGSALDVRDLRLEELIDGEWVALGTPEPAGVTVRVPLPDVHVFAQPTLTVRPTAQWTAHTLRVPAGQLAGQGRLGALLQLEAGTDVALRDVRLTGAGTDGKVAMAEPKRRSKLLFEQENLAGHSYVTSGLLAMMLLLVGPARASRRTQQDAGRRPRRRRLVGALVMAALSLAAVTTTGSRTALVGAVGGAAALLVGPWLTRATASGKRLLRWSLGALLAVALLLSALFALAPGSDALGRLAFWQDRGATNQVSRVEIWRTAVDGMMSAPLGGWGADGFPELWRARHPEDGRAVPQHAHNFWLQLGAAYGLPGLLAALWLSGGLVAMAVRTGRLGPPLLVGVLLTMQLFDHTLTYVGVLVPLVAAVNTVQPGNARLGESSRVAGELKA